MICGCKIDWELPLSIVACLNPEEKPSADSPGEPASVEIVGVWCLGHDITDVFVGKLTNKERQELEKIILEKEQEDYVNRVTPNIL